MRVRTVTARSAPSSRVATDRISVAMIVAARSVRTRRAAIVRTSTATIVRPRRDRDDAPSGRALLRQEVRRQETLHPAGRWRREAALHPARRRFQERRRPAPWRSSFQRAAVARWRSAGAKIRWRQEVLITRRAGSRPAQGLWQPSRPGAAQGFWFRSRRFKAVAEARGSRRARFPSGPRRRAQFRQAAFRPAA